MGKRTKEQRQRKSVEMLLYTEAEEQEFNSSSNVPYPVLNLANDRQQVTPNRPNMDARAHGRKASPHPHPRQSATRSLTRNSH